MAVNLIQLAAALRLGDGENPPTEPVAGLITRLLGVSQAFVARAAPEAPDAIADEATIRMTAYLYDSPTAAAGGRYAQAWRNSGAEALVSRWVVRRAGSEGEGVPAGGPSTGGLDDAQVRAIVDEVLAAHTDVETAHHVPPTGAQDSVEDTANRLINAAGHASNTDLSAADQAIQRNANALTTHEATPHGGGNGGTPATPTPPVVLVDGALYSAYGDITIPGWRGYDFFQLLFTNGADTYQSEPINSVQLIAHSPVVVSMSRNVGWRLTIDASDDDVITIASTGGNTIAAPTATSAMTVIGWFAGTVVDGGGGGDGTDQTARDAAAANTAAATAHAADANAHHTPPTGGEGGGDDAYPWATEGNDDLVPTDKVNLSGVQNQIDAIVDEIAHSEGTINAVVGVLGAGSSSLRYTLPVDLDGLYDVSVRVKARVQINEFQNISGNLHITEDGGLGLNTEIPEAVHNYHHAHEGTFNFIRKGLAIAPGASQINFTALVTGASPPAVHFVEVENLTMSKAAAGGAGGFTQLHATALFAPATARTMRDTGYAVADLPDLFMVCFHIGAPGHFAWIRKSDVLLATALAPDAQGSSTHYVRSGDYNDIQTYVGRTTGGNLSCGISSEPSSFSIVIGSFG